MRKTSLTISFYIVGCFLLFAVVILIVAGISLLFPYTFWKEIWFFKQQEYQQMLPNRILIGVAFWLLAIVMLLAGIGWFRKSHWGWVLTMGVFLVNGLSDAARFLMGSYLEGVIGVTVTACIIFYLTRPRVKKLFTHSFK